MLKFDASVILAITVLNVSATPGLVTTRIGSRVDVSAGCHCGVVFWISMRGGILNYAF
jgi:hypothetical protein